MLYLRGMNILNFLFGIPTVRINSLTSKLDMSTIKKIVYMSLTWCEDNMSRKGHKKPPYKISIRKQTYGEPCYGQYDEDTNTIYIFYNNCGNVELLIRTVLHEYTHYLQPIEGKYHKLLKKHGYDKHPQEVEARKMEEYYLNVWKYIKSN